MSIRRGDVYFVDLDPVRVAIEDSGLPLETVFLGFHVRSLDPKRFSDPPAGRLTEVAMRRLEAAVRRCLGL